jgi:hypothetical protein
MKEIGERVEQVNKDLKRLAKDIMERVSQSQDEVSAALAPIFATAVSHSEPELQRAKQRKERGQPPGKQAGPIGDELTWEQILSRFVGRKKLWILTKDSDYGHFYDGEGFLNEFLYEELRKVSPDAEAFLFGDVADGIKHFAAVTGVKADKLPSREQMEEIKTEENTLPPLDPPYEGRMYSRPFGNYLDLSFSSRPPLPLRAGTVIPSGETGLPWSQITSDEPPKEPVEGSRGSFCGLE